MARSKGKHITIRHEEILRMEGLIQKLVEMEPRERPKAEAVRLIAQHLGYSPRLVREWVTQIRPMARRQDTAEAFWNAYERIAELLSENIYSEVHKMARAGERDSFKAAMWLLPRINPEAFDPNVQVEAEEDDVFDTSSVSQEVFDRISIKDDYRERLARIRQTVHDAVENYETLIRTVQSELMAEELIERKNSTAPVTH